MIQSILFFSHSNHSICRSQYNFSTIKIRWPYYLFYLLFFSLYNPNIAIATQMHKHTNCRIARWRHTAMFMKQWIGMNEYYVNVWERAPNRISNRNTHILSGTYIRPRYVKANQRINYKKPDSMMSHLEDSRFAWILFFEFSCYIDLLHLTEFYISAYNESRQRE